MRRLSTRSSGRRASPATLPDGPAVDLLDAVRRGDWDSALAMLPPDVEIAAPQFDTVISGASVPAHARDALNRFPDLTYAPHTRRAGPGLVVDDGFITGTQTGGTQPTGLPMTATVKVTAEHDGQQVQRLTVALDPTALMRALGRPVDGSAALYSDLQTLRAGMHDGLTVHALTVPESPPQATTGRPARHRGRLLAVGAALLAIGGAAAAQMVNDEAPARPSARETPAVAVASETPAAAREPSPAPTEPEQTRKPSIVLSADLAFASNSAEVSPAAQQRILALADRARGLEGVITVDGYADNVGSARSGLIISRARATTVADILRAALRRDPRLTVRAVGHGESDPVASNATADGRAKNRRVTVTLPPG